MHEIFKAMSKKELVKYIRTNNIFGLDLHGLDLSHTNLRDVEIHNSNLTDVNLQGANLRSATISYSWLINANLQGTVLTNTSLKCVNLDGTGLMMFRYELHTAYFNQYDQMLRIGCEYYSLDYWLREFARIGRGYNYTPKHIEKYHQFMLMCQGEPTK